MMHPFVGESLLAQGLTNEEVLAELPYLEKEDITACLHYAASKLNHPILSAA